MPENTKKSKTVKQTESSPSVKESKITKKSTTPLPKGKAAAPAPVSKTPAKNQKGGKVADAPGKKPKKKVRYFKIIDPKTGITCGRYVGDTPKQAAGKAYSKQIQKLKKEGKKVKQLSTIFLRESSRGSHRKIYAYEAKRNKLDEPQVLTFVSKETGETKVITYKYRNDIKKIKVPENFNVLTVRKTTGSKTSKNTKSGQKNATKTTQSAGKSGSKSAAKPSGKTPSKATGKTAGKNSTVTKKSAAPKATKSN